MRQLKAADAGTYAEVVRNSEMLPIAAQQVLAHSHTRSEKLFFIESGVVALLGSTVQGASVELGIVGVEGVAGATATLGGGLPYSVVVRVAGLATRLPASIAQRLVRTSPAFGQLLLAHAEVLTGQLAQSAICNRFHTAQQRLARWLLLTVQQANVSELELTHELIAQMMGIPRPAVSQAAAKLKSSGAIDYRRGVIVIGDLPTLRRASCECFDVMSRLLRRRPA